MATAVGARRPSTQDEISRDIIWWALVGSALFFVTVLPRLLLDWLPAPTQAMTIQFGQSGAFVTLDLTDPPGFWWWMAIVGSMLGLMGAVSWWLGRHSVRLERWQPGLARWRDRLLAMVVLVVLTILVVGEIGRFAEDGALMVECFPPTCEVPSSLQFPTAVEYLLPWIAAIPMALGLVFRSRRPRPTSERLRGSAYQKTMVVVLASCNAVVVLPAVVLGLARLT